MLQLLVIAALALLVPGAIVGALLIRDRKLYFLASARNLLTGRGIPFTERTVNSNEDIEALKRLSGNTSLPFGSIGGQQLHGFSDAEWTQYLDAAGYPQQSQLPASYHRPAATPLVAAVEKKAPAASDAPARRAVPVPAPAPAPAATPSNPAGIQF